MDSAIENLVQLGLKEYEARIYVALVGLGEANVRRIHEVSGVPRPRVYDVLNELDAKGFINIRQGSPLMYYAVRPDSVVSFLKKDLDTAARGKCERPLKFCQLMHSRIIRRYGMSTATGPSRITSKSWWRESTVNLLFSVSIKRP